MYRVPVSERNSAASRFGFDIEARTAGSESATTVGLAVAQNPALVSAAALFKASRSRPNLAFEPFRSIMRAGWPVSSRMVQSSTFSTSSPSRAAACR